ncbi:hypothetical protein BGZ91_010736 [Linnemannia elongata]|nr:hypothetical protein BGZ91_010736 [Linnemannia elongata]
MDNYAHVDKPEHIRALTFTMVLRRHHEQQTDSNFSSANFFTADSDTAIAIVSASREPFLISKTLHQKPTRTAPLQLNSRQLQAHKDDQATSTTTSDDTLPTSQNPSRRTHSPRAPQESAPGVAKDFAKTMANASLGANMRCSILARCTGARTDASRLHQAMTWYLKAAKQGLADAQRYVLARKAVEQGRAKACPKSIPEHKIGIDRPLIKGTRPILSCPAPYKSTAVVFLRTTCKP